MWRGGGDPSPFEKVVGLSLGVKRVASLVVVICLFIMVIIGTRGGVRVLGMLLNL